MRTRHPISAHLALTLAVVLFGWGKADAATVCSSGCDYATITACAASAAAFDTCEVSAGVYSETVPPEGARKGPSSLFGAWLSEWSLAAVLKSPLVLPIHQIRFAGT